MHEAHPTAKSTAAFTSFLPNPLDTLSLSRPIFIRNLRFPISAAAAAKTLIALSPKPPPQTPLLPSISPTPTLHHPSDSDTFQEKMLYLESYGIDLFRVAALHPPVVSVPLAHIRSTVDFFTSLNFTAVDFRRIAGMCPEVLSLQVSDLAPVVTFLLREARVNGPDLRRAISRRPRLLCSSVEKRLRPTLYFLQSIGLSQVNRHTHLLSCSVEDKLIPRIDYLETIGLSRSDAVSMVRRFPALFCYSIKENLEPKFNYFVAEMGRDLKDLKEFPQYFSFSLENRIKPRHSSCVEKGVFFSLPVMLKLTEAQFWDRLNLCCNTSMPLRTSPLWSTAIQINSL